MKTAAQLEIEYVAAAARGMPAPLVEQLRPMLKHFAEVDAALWQRLELVTLRSDPELHKKLDAMATDVGRFQRHTSNVHTDGCPIWNANERCWEESDDQLRARIAQALEEPRCGAV